jgi:alpha-tubulin suppressor-like RCC1 family protein
MKTTSNCAILSGLLAMAALPIAGGCGSEGTTEPESNSESEASVEITLTTMPTSAQCVRITVTASSGSATSKSFTIAAGASTANLNVGTFRPGDYTITGDTFNVACASVGTSVGDWIADPLAISVRAGVPTFVTLTFRKNAPIRANANFVPSATGVATGYYSNYIATDVGILQYDSLSKLFQRTNFTAFDSTAVPGNAIAAITPTLRGACAIRADGTVWCWGTSTSGELGPGVAIGSTALTPVQVTGLSSSRLIAGGAGHVCAAAGTGLYCWGSNTYGQLGNNSTTNSATPVFVSLGDGVRSLAVGSEASYVVTSVGDLVSWGHNSYGQLGDGSTSDYHVPHTVNDGTLQVAAGAFHACAIAADGTTASCWGYNAYGQLGDGTTNNRFTPTVVAGIQAKVLTAGQGHTCALTATGQTQCWGSGGWGQLGDGLAQQQLRPTETKLGALSLIYLAAGPMANSTCGIATTLDLYCWGQGQIGDGTGNAAFVPVRVPL